MIKAVLFDADGFVIKNHEYFSIRYKRDFGKSLNDEVITNFFRNEYKQTASGSADLKKLLKEKVGEWGWKGSIDELLKYWFEGERKLDLGVLGAIKRLRDKGIKCALVSDNEKYRAEYLLNEVGLKKYFNYTFFSCNLGYTKSEPEFFKEVIKKLKFKPEEIAYFDDDPKNVEIAKSVGIDARVYKSIIQLQKILYK